MIRARALVAVRACAGRTTIGARTRRPTPFGLACAGSLALLLRLSTLSLVALTLLRSLAAFALLALALLFGLLPPSKFALALLLCFAALAKLALTLLFRLTALLLLALALLLGLTALALFLLALAFRVATSTSAFLLGAAGTSTICISARRTRRIVAKPPFLARAKRFRLRHVIGWTDDVLCLPDTRAFPLNAPAPEFFASHLNCALDPGGPSQYARAYLVRPQRPADRRSNEGWRNSRIDRDARAAVANDHGPVHHHGFADEYGPLAQRQNNRRDSRRSEITRANEDPHIRFITIFDDDLVGGQRRPADVLRTTPPLNPCRRPLLCWHPNPAEIGIKHPAPVVIDDPAEVLVRCPVPSPILGVDPASNLVRAPITIDPRWDPDLAPARMAVPSAVRIEASA